MPVTEKNTSYSFTMTTDQLATFLKKVKDLVAIDSRIILRIDNQSILMFSFVGESFKNIHAFKNYIFDREEIMGVKKEITDPIIFISKDGKKLYRTLNNLIDYEEEIKGKISINDEDYVNYFSFNNDRMDIKIIGSDPISIGKEIGIDDVNYLMNTENSLFNFELGAQDFAKIKKMGLIENEPNSVLYLNIDNKKLSIGETKWHLNICEIEDIDDTMMIFPKKYFNTINPLEVIKIYVFETFILCKYDDYNLMILMETSI